MDTRLFRRSLPQAALTGLMAALAYEVMVRTGAPLVCAVGGVDDCWWHRQSRLGRGRHPLIVSDMWTLWHPRQRLGGFGRRYG